MKKILIVVLIVAGFHATAQIGGFTLPNVVDGKNISLESFPSCSGIVVIFTSNVCPFDEHYRARINKLSKDFSDKVPVLLVNAYTEAPESVDAMTKKAKELGLTIPYLADKDQTLMQTLKATKSPQCFLLKNNGGKFNVVYSGAIDDNAQVEADVRVAYLRDAIDIMLTNQSIRTPEVRTAGCNIKKKS
jgi:hypothetical protein